MLSPSSTGRMGRVTEVKGLAISAGVTHISGLVQASAPVPMPAVAV